MGRRWYSQSSLGRDNLEPKKKGTEKCSAFLVQGPGQEILFMGRANLKIVLIWEANQDRA